jgi:hypothetical protein
LIRRAAPVLVVASIALLAFAVGASAHKKVFSSDLTAQVMDPSADTLVVDGLVTSSKKACLAGRKIVATTFSKTEIDTETVGTATTDSTGAFQFDLSKSARGGIVLVEVLPKRVAPKAKKHRHLCGAGSTGIPVI